MAGRGPRRWPMAPPSRPAGKHAVGTTRDLVHGDRKGTRLMNVIRAPAAAVGRWLGSVRPERRHLRADLLAGLPGAISSVPDGMAAAVLVGVNPVQGLYASFAGPIAGGLTSSTRLMVITTTSAASLAAGSALRSVPAAQRPEALLLLALMAGAVLVAAGLAGLGRYTRFVSYSVMIGFLTGISVNIACGQVADLTGAEAHGAFPLAKAVDVLIHPARIDLASLLTGLAALAALIRQQDLAMPCGQFASVKLCQPTTEADGKPVTESNLSLRAFAQVAAVMIAQRRRSGSPRCPRRTGYSAAFSEATRRCRRRALAAGGTWLFTVRTEDL
jgi:MFS superfamily sulfate permease-like transporter